MPKEDILPVPLYIGHLLWTYQEFHADVHPRTDINSSYATEEPDQEQAASSRCVQSSLLLDHKGYFSFQVSDA